MNESKELDGMGSDGWEQGQGQGQGQASKTKTPPLVLPLSCATYTTPQYLGCVPSRADTVKKVLDLLGLRLYIRFIPNSPVPSFQFLPNPRRRSIVVVDLYCQGDKQLGEGRGLRGTIPKHGYPGY